MKDCRLEKEYLSADSAFLLSASSSALDIRVKPELLEAAIAWVDRQGWTIKGGQSRTDSQGWTVKEKNMMR